MMWIGRMGNISPRMWGWGERSVLQLEGLKPFAMTFCTALYADEDNKPVVGVYEAIEPMKETPTCIGDGLTDATAAVQKIVDGEGCLFLPRGKIADSVLPRPSYSTESGHELSQEEKTISLKLADAKKLLAVLTQAQLDWSKRRGALFGAESNPYTVFEILLGALIAEAERVPTAAPIELPSIPVVVERKKDEKDQEGKGRTTAHDRIKDLIKEKQDEVDGLKGLEILLRTVSRYSSLEVLLNKLLMDYQVPKV